LSSNATCGSGWIVQVQPTTRHPGLTALLDSGIFSIDNLWKKEGVDTVISRVDVEWPIMDKLVELWRRLIFTFRRGRFDRELEEEIRFHLDMKSRAHIGPGDDIAGGNGTANSETRPRSSRDPETSG
jgi:hypothetical protein